MATPWKKKQLLEDGDLDLVPYENKLQKYLDRMYLVVQCKHPKYKMLTEDAIFQELDKVISCQLILDIDAS
jgi:hypothetical protein